MKELVENIEKQISTDKEVISVLPRNGIRAIKSLLETIKDMTDKYEALNENVLQEIAARYDRLTDVEENVEIHQIEEEILRLNNKMVDNMNIEALLIVYYLITHFKTATGIVKAVDGVTFSLDSGQTLGIVGESGCGKSVTSSSIMRLLPKNGHIVEGSILFEGKDIVKLSQKEMLQIRGNDISMIFQDPMTALNPVMTIGSQIAEVIRIHNQVSAAEADVKAMKMLEMVGIPAERFPEYPHQFSGGMKQRVVIAMALACNPELLLADEPTTALDVTIQAQVLEMINELKQKFSTSMILITHDLGVVAETCDNVAVIYAGKIIESGTKADIFLNPQHPYTLGLFSSVPKLHDEASRLSPIPGLPPDPANLPAGCSFHPRCPHATDVCRQCQPEMHEVSPGHYCSCLIKKQR